MDEIVKLADTVNKGDLKATVKIDRSTIVELGVSILFIAIVITVLTQFFKSFIK